ncbi:MAG TPA: hypothetical protein VMW67_08350 [Desulfobacteria bacterium]|nr:hypothetical protein [Desulfobacteria bacterium]
MNYVVLLVSAIFLVVSILIVKRSGSGLEPIFHEDFPEKLKPYFRMNKCQYRAVAYPRHQVLSELQNIGKMNEENISNIRIDLISYNFQYEGYEPRNIWYQALVQILKSSGTVNLIGGKPGPERLVHLQKLEKLGAKIRFLDEPITNHIFTVWQKEDPIFIWFEKYHKEDKAYSVAFTTHPGPEDGLLVQNDFNEIWARGVAA